MSMQEIESQLMAYPNVVAVVVKKDKVVVYITKEAPEIALPRSIAGLLIEIKISDKVRIL